MTKPLFTITFTAEQAVDFIKQQIKDNYSSLDDFDVVIQEKSMPDVKLENPWLIPDADGWFMHDSDWKSETAPDYVDRNKEILAPTKKAILYSPETCCVVPSEINTMLIGMNRSKFNGLPKGIFKIKEGYRVRALSVNSVNISNKFATIAECNKWRNSVDQSRFIFVANKYKSVLESAVYERLCNWDKF